MGTIILHNIVSLIMIFAFIFVLKVFAKSNFSKNKQLIIKVIGAILIMCVVVYVLFIDAIAVGIIGLIPNDNYTADVAKIK